MFLYTTPLCQKRIKLSSLNNLISILELSYFALLHFSSVSGETWAILLDQSYFYLRTVLLLAILSLFYFPLIHFSSYISGKKIGNHLKIILLLFWTVLLLSYKRLILFLYTSPLSQKRKVLSSLNNLIIVLLVSYLCLIASLHLFLFALLHLSVMEEKLLGNILKLS